MLNTDFLLLLTRTKDTLDEIRPTVVSLINSSKHIQNELHRVEEVPYLIEALTAILGSEDAVKERKIFSPKLSDCLGCRSYKEDAVPL